VIQEVNQKKNEQNKAKIMVSHLNSKIKLKQQQDLEKEQQRKLYQ